MFAEQLKIAAAPTFRGQCEVPGWGHQMSRDRVLQDMVTLGIHATDAQLAGRVAAGDLTFSEAGGVRVFCSLGDGDADLDTVLGSVRTARNGGWHVMEQDVMLSRVTP